MNHYYFYLLIWILSAGFYQALGPEVFQKPIVVIDPGHGGTDVGAVGVNGLKEKEVVLKITREVLRLNRLLFHDTLEIYTTRYTDTLISLGDRTKLVQGLQADLFVSIHCNQAVRKQAQGVEVYVKRGEGKSKDLANLFATGLQEKLGFKNRGVKYGDFQVLRETTTCPAILLEFGFLSNQKEAKHLGKHSSISGYALLILETLLNYLRHD